ncbi:MAG: AraC family ligand binding domain-containing protein [Myxococcales bacterium]|nr:AraC family ligand binding domain-containing protein [Myxococcales bacterium]
MTRSSLKAAIVACVASVASCASSPAVPAAQPTVAPSVTTTPVSVVLVPVPPGDGDGREVRTLLDVPQLKLASIILRRGTVLPEHAAPMPVTIQAVAGSGTVRIGAKRVRLDAAHMVFLAPNTVHEIEPDPGTDVVLLVHHLRGGRARP